MSEPSAIQKSAEIIRGRLPGGRARLAVMLGSGLGGVAEDVKGTRISYADLPGFPQPTVKGHAGKLGIAEIAGESVLFLQGRQHLYEGAGAGGIKTMIRTLKTLGVETLVITNAAGSLISAYGPGTLVAIADHINLAGINPLTGQNEDDWGPRFVAMTNAWDKDLRALLMDSANRAGVSVGTGVYACFPGPTFETPAEVNMARIIGADLVGMSTVPENIIARHCGIKCAGISIVSNLAAGMDESTLSHAQTLEGAARGADDLKKLLGAFIPACLSQGE